MFPREYVNYQNKLYWVYKKVKQSHIKEGFVQDVRELWNCDIVLKHRNSDDEYLLFLREIPELELVPE